MTTMTQQVQPPPGRDFTRADLDALPDDGRRHELLDGMLLVTPAPAYRHQVAVMNVIAALSGQVSPDSRLLVAPFDVALSEITVLQPDLLVAPRDAFTERDLPTAPLLAIEILSPSTRLLDLNTKKAKYAEAGVAHYWTVDPGLTSDPSFTTWQLDDTGEYRQTGHASGDKDLAITEPFPVTINPQRLLD